MSLDRFLQALEKTYAGALAELQAGRKTGHWIWWVFPQLRGLGKSEFATFYGLADEAEARAYLQHPILGVRYRACVAAVHAHICERGADPQVVMGSEVDVLKLASSLELFLDAAEPADGRLRGWAADMLARLRLKDSA